jgi:glutathione S-transferase
MAILYYSPGAASLLPHWLLIELGVPHELRLVDFASKQQKSADYLALNPSGVVPTLVIDGRPMTEAAAIALHLAETHPDAKLVPPIGDPARRDCLQWMFHLAQAVQSLFRIWWYPHEVAGGVQADSVQADAARAHVAPRIGAAWDRIDAHLAAHAVRMKARPSFAALYAAEGLEEWA